MARPLGKPIETHGKDWVALVLTVGLCSGVNFITIGVLIDAIRNESPGLSENATQILVAAFGGMVGVIGSYIGYRAGTIDQLNRTDPTVPQDSPTDVDPPGTAPAPVRPTSGTTGTNPTDSERFPLT